MVAAVDIPAVVAAAAVDNTEVGYADNVLVVSGCSVVAVADCCMIVTGDRLVRVFWLCLGFGRWARCCSCCCC